MLCFISIFFSVFKRTVHTGPVRVWTFSASNQSCEYFHSLKCFTSKSALERSAGVRLPKINENLIDPAAVRSTNGVQIRRSLSLDENTALCLYWTSPHFCPTFAPSSNQLKADASPPYLAFSLTGSSIKLPKNLAVQIAFRRYNISVLTRSNLRNRTSARRTVSGCPLLDVIPSSSYSYGRPTPLRIP